MQEHRNLTHLIVEFYEKLSSWEHCVVRDKGLSLSQMHILEILGVHQAMRMKELAERMGVTTGTLTVLVDKLVANGLVQRRPHDTDRRSVLVGLTDQGLGLFHEHHDLHLRLTHDITAGLEPKERQALETALEKMILEF